MNSVLVDEKLIRNAIVRGDSIYIDWNSDFDVFQDVSKVRVREIRKKPEYTLCKTYKNTTKNKKIEVVFSKKALDMLLELNKEHIEELKSNVSAETDFSKIQNNLNKLKESIKTYEIIEKSVNSTLSI